MLGPYLARTLAGSTIIQIIGIRRDESSARSKALMVWHPIAHWSSEQVFALHAQLGIPLHEAYSCYGLTRLSCRCCVLQSQADSQAAASAPANRPAFIHLVDLEARSTFSFQPGRWLADTAPQLLPASLVADVTRAKHDAEERRALEGGMPPELRFCRGWPPRMPTSGEADRIAAARAPILRRHRLENRFADGAAVRRRFAELIAAKAA